MRTITLHFTLAMLLLVPMTSGAAVTVNMVQAGANVQVSISGSLNLAGLPPPAPAVGTASIIVPNTALVYNLSSGLYDRYSIASAPAPFGSGGLTNATSQTVPAGSDFGVNGISVFVTPGYISGTPINASMQFDGTTLASLGVTPGTYVWTLANGETVTLHAGPPPAAVPALSPWGLMLMALALMATAGYTARTRLGR